jgi:Tol biopolymer transport system component
MKQLAAMTAVAGMALIVGLVAGPSDAVAQRVSASPVEVRHEGNVHFPLFSPDGTQIAYEVNYPAEKRTELWMVAWRGRSIEGEAIKLVPESMASSSRYGGGKRITHGFAWASGGKHAYAYSVSDSTGAQAIYVDGWSDMVAFGNSANKNPDWDPNEARFVFSSGRTGNGDLYLWDSGEPLQLTYDDDNAELYPTFNSSGDKVVYVRQGKGGSHIFILDVKQFVAQPLVQYEGKESTRPSFSPDGTKVAFFSNKATKSVTRFGLWVTDARPGSTPRNIAPQVYLPSKGGASWTPDGRALVAVANDPEAGDPVCVYPVDGGSAQCLSLGTRNNRDPQLQLIDGSWRLVYTAQDKESDSSATWREMYVADLPH